MHDSVDTHFAAVSDFGAVEDPRAGGEEDLFTDVSAGHARHRTDQRVRADVHRVGRARPHEGVLHHDRVLTEDDPTPLRRQNRPMKHLTARPHRDIAADDSRRCDDRIGVNAGLFLEMAESHRRILPVGAVSVLPSHAHARPAV